MLHRRGSRYPSRHLYPSQASLLLRDRVADPKVARNPFVRLITLLTDYDDVPGLLYITKSGSMKTRTQLAPRTKNRLPVDASYR